MNLQHQSSSLDKWDVPPSTEGPNARARRAKGLPLYSGTSAPLPGPATQVQQQEQKSFYTAEEWRGWQREQHRQQQEGERPWAGEQQQQQYRHVQKTMAPISQPLYYEIDPSLPFPSPADFQRPYTSYPDAQTPQLYEPAPTPTSYSWEERQRQASSATVIDHGSPPSSPAFDGLPELTEEMVEPPVLFSKEEWLRLGGFAPIEDKAQSAPTLTRYQPFETRATIAELGWAELPSPRYSFPSTLHPFNPTGPPYVHSQHPPPSPYDLPPLPPLPDLPCLPSPSPLPEQAGSLTQASHCGTSNPDEVPVDLTVDSIPPSRPLPRSRTRQAPSSTSGRSSNRIAPYPSQSASSTISPADLYPPTMLNTPSSAFNANLPLGTSVSGTSSSNPPPLLPPLNEHRKSHGRKRSIGHVSRPRNAFILFRSHAVATNLIPRHLGIKHERNVSQVVAQIWRNLPPEEKKHWELLAEEEKRAHKEKYPEYVFKPKLKGPRKPVGQGKKALAKKAKVKEGEKGDEDDLIISDEEEYVPGPTVRTRAGRQPKPKATRVPKPTLPKELPEVTARKMQLVGKALAEGEQSERIEDRVKLELELEQEPGVGPPPKPEKSRYPRRRQPLNVVEAAALPLPPSNPSTPRKTRASTRPGPYTSPSSDILVNSPASSTSTVSPSREHSFRQTRLAKRGSNSTWTARGDGSTPLSSSSTSPQRQQQPASSSPSPVKSPLSQSVTSHRGSKGYGQLGVAGSSRSTTTKDAHVPPQCNLPSFGLGKSPFLAGRAFDNSPLLGGAGADRKSSLGRWELRKPSTTMSRREMMAQEEETMEIGAGGGKTFSKAFTIDPQLFLAEAGLEDEAGYGDSYLPSQVPSQPHFSTPLKPGKPSPPTSTYYAKDTTYALPPVEYHFGGQDLFSTPSNDLFGCKMAKSRNGSGASVGSGGGQPSAMYYGLQLDDRRSTYSAETGVSDLGSYQ